MSRRLLTGLLCAACLTPGCGALTSMAQEQMSGAASALVAGGAKAGMAVLPIGVEEEKAYGGAIAVMIVQRYGGLDEDSARNRYVQLVGQAVAMHSARPDLDYHFAVLASDDVNALSAPGGYVFVTRGALAKMSTEAELAGVLAHEVAHVDARHALEIIRKLKARNELAKATEAWRDAAIFGGLIDGFLGDYLDKGLPQETEHEADALATALLTRIGWHPGGLRDFLAVLQAEQKRDAAFYRSHPDTAVRIRRLEAQIGGPAPASGELHAERFAAAVRPDPAPAPVPAPAAVPVPAAVPAPVPVPAAVPVPAPAAVPGPAPAAVPAPAAAAAP